MAGPIKSLKHADGTPVSAQEAYNAFMNTRVLIVIDETTYEAISMLWHDNNSAQGDPTNVGYVKLSYVSQSAGAVVFNDVNVGDPSLAPT